MKNGYLMALLAISLLACNKGSDPVPTDQLNGCIQIDDDLLRAGNNIYFTSCSQNATSWHWNFGDGYSSTQENPVHAYKSAGSYTVTLLVSDGEKEHEVTKEVTVAEALVFYHPGQTWTNDSTWVKGQHIVLGQIVLDGANLTIEPGAVIKFKGHTGIDVGPTGSGPSSIIAEGTAQDSIVFTSYYESTKGSYWTAIAIGPEASRVSSLKYVKLEHGGYTDDYGGLPNAPLELKDGGTVKMNYSVIKESHNYGIYLSEASAFTEFTHNVVDLETENKFVIHIDLDNWYSIGNTNSLKGKGIEFSSSDVTTDVTLTPMDIPYITEHSIRLGSATENTFTITAGTTLNFEGGGAILSTLTGVADGHKTKLVIDGTAENPVILKCIDENSYWNGIWLDEVFSRESTIDHVKMYRTAGRSSYPGMISVVGTTLNLTNSYLSGPAPYNIYMHDDAEFGIYENNILGEPSSDNFNIHFNHLYKFPVVVIPESPTQKNTGIFVRRRSTSLTEDLTIKDVGAPYSTWSYIIIGDEANPTAGPTVTIDPGVNIKFMGNNGIYVGAYENFDSPGYGANGNLIINGTAENPVVLEPFEAGSDWGGISFMEGTTAVSSIDHAIISGGIWQSIFIDVENGATGASYPIIKNSTLSNSGRYPIYVETNSSPDIQDSNTYTGNGLGDFVFYE